MAVQELRMRDESFFGVFLAGHFMLADGGGNKFHALQAGGAQRPFT